MRGRIEAGHYEKVTAERSMCRPKTAGHVAQHGGQHNQETREAAAALTFRDGRHTLKCNFEVEPRLVFGQRVQHVYVDHVDGRHGKADMYTIAPTQRWTRVAEASRNSVPPS